MKSETLPRCWASAGPVLRPRIGLHAVNTVLWPHVGLMLAQRPRRWPSIKPPRIKRLSFDRQGSHPPPPPHTHTLSVHPWSPNLWLRSLYLIQRPRSPARLYCTRYRITKPQSALQVPRSLPSQHVATNAGLMLGQRRKRWPNIKPALVDLCMKSVSVCSQRGKIPIETSCARPFFSSRTRQVKRAVSQLDKRLQPNVRWKFRHRLGRCDKSEVGVW